MELDVSVNKKSFSITIENPHRLDLDGTVSAISDFAVTQGASLDGLDVRGVLPRMVRGVFGCEEGCPANARELVERGYANFSLAYVEGGILTASAKSAKGDTLALKLFPEF